MYVNKTSTTDEMPAFGSFEVLSTRYTKLMAGQFLSARDSTRMKTGIINSGKCSNQEVSEISALLVSNKMSTVIKLSDYDFMMTSEIKNIQKFLNEKNLKKN